MQPPRKKPRSSPEAQDGDRKDDDSFATFTFNSTAFQEGNVRAHEGDVIADAGLKTDSGIVRIRFEGRQLGDHDLFQCH